ncbi:MAG TPA: hypothetical protein ENL08_05770 [Bacteroidetes bacterium]|nr:hypothetical protein [Bacteroidota bacterium]
MDKSQKPEQNNASADMNGVSNFSDEVVDNLKESDGKPSRKDGLTDSKLPWLIHDFEGITENIYEGVMAAAVRARQIGRRQKQEIDVWHKSHEPVDGAGEEEESEPGIDHFQHSKPTVKALKELSERKLIIRYRDEGEK